MSALRPRAWVLLALAALLAGAGCGGENAALTPELDEPLYRDGQQKKREGQNQQALADFLRVIAKRGDQAPEAHMEAGLIYRGYDPIAAIYHFKKYVELEPNSRQVANVRDLINAAERDFAKTLPLVTSAIDGAAGHSDLLEEVNRLQRENDDLRARLASLRGEVSPSLAFHPAGDTASAPVPVAAAPVPVPAPEEASPVAPPAAEPPAPPPPAAAARPRPAPSAPARAEHGRSYTVQAHDTLYKIAAKVYGKATASRVQAIEQANHLSGSSGLKPGMELKMP
jgi:LysM domain